MNKSKRLLILIIILTSFASCTDENITNTYIDATSSIIGRVMSVEFDNEISIWQAEKIASTHADSLGYFELESAPFGIYEMRIVNSANTMIMHNIEVKKNETTSLGEIIFNYLPWPFISTSPIKDDQSVAIRPFGWNIYFYSEEAIDLESFENSINITPPIPGTWETYSYEGRYSYSLAPDQHLPPNTNYTMTISPDLLLLESGRWGDSLQISFKTEKFKVLEKTFPYPLSGMPSVIDYILMRYRFNLGLNESIARSVITVDPPINLEFDFSTYNVFGEIRISTSDTLTPGTTYTLTIGKDLESESGYKFGEDEVIEFTVQPE